MGINTTREQKTLDQNTKLVHGTVPFGGANPAGKARCSLESTARCTGCERLQREREVRIRHQSLLVARGAQAATYLHQESIVAPKN